MATVISARKRRLKNAEQIAAGVRRFRQGVREPRTAANVTPLNRGFFELESLRAGKRAVRQRNAKVRKVRSL